MYSHLNGNIELVAANISRATLDVLPSQKNLFPYTHVEFAVSFTAHTYVHTNISHAMHRAVDDRQNDIYIYICIYIYIYLTFYCIRVQYPTKRHSKNINRDRKKQRYFRHYLLADGAIIAILNVSQRPNIYHFCDYFWQTMASSAYYFKE